MPLREDLLNPIAGENPSGVDVRYDSKLLLYDKIKEARREDDGLDQGAWQQERKAADVPLVLKLTQEALATKTKDLQLCAWLTEAMLRTEGYGGLRQGLALCRGVVANFWDTLYPPIDDGDLELRAAPLDWLGSAIDFTVRNVPITRAGYGFVKYKESRTVGYEAQVSGEKERTQRETRIKEGKLTPEDFDKAFVETPKAFYVQCEKDLDGCLEALKNLDETCDEKFGNAGPSFGKLKTALEEIRHTVHSLLQKKRETEPDPVEETQAEGGAEVGSAEGGAPGGGSRSAMPSIIISVMTSSEPADRREVIASIAKAAAFLRQKEPLSPAPYLMMRGLRWGELRAAARLSNAALLEAPPTELRQQVKRLALAEKWTELLEIAENAMSLPCSRAWLDLQKHVVDACNALGSDYEPIAAAIRLELKVLLHDVPELLDASLLDDTPAANGDTRTWLLRLLRPSASGSGPSSAVEGNGAAESAQAALSDAISSVAPEPSWPSKSADRYDVATEALKAGLAEKAFEIMQREIASQTSGRERFRRKLQLVQLCVAAGKDAIAQPLLDDIAAAIENHKLDEWEDRQMIGTALSTLMTLSTRIKESSSEKQKLFERICRLDPARALTAG
ncbi:MAG TPA: type VI secretion system protein TssA [Candidatus Acidoferrum sp.]|jgi:type VI secretion system protein ImpA|nr:type VI secretion system protein TssA [Candidatus Acidoferrum sp.]